MSAEEMIEMKGAFEINDLLYVLNIIWIMMLYEVLIL